jgi:hypothetical protein
VGTGSETLPMLREFYKRKSNFSMGVLSIMNYSEGINCFTREKWVSHCGDCEELVYHLLGCDAVWLVCSEYSFSILKPEALLRYNSVIIHVMTPPENSTVQHILKFLLSKVFKNRPIFYRAKTKQV